MSAAKSHMGRVEAIFLCDLENMLVGIYALLSTLQAEADHGGVAQPVAVRVPNKAGNS